MRGAHAQRPPGRPLTVRGAVPGRSQPARGGSACPLRRGPPSPTGCTAGPGACCGLLGGRAPARRMEVRTNNQGGGADAAGGGDGAAGRGKSAGAKAKGAAKRSAGSEFLVLTPQQRFKAMLRRTEDARERLVRRVVASPPAAAALAAWAAFLAATAPVREPALRFAAKTRAWYREELRRYQRFCAYETKREWHWRRRMRREWEWWRQVVIGAWFFGATVLYQMATPPSILFAVLFPCYCSWIISDRPWLSPVALACYIMLPMKFVPWAPIRFLW
ncbi:unnamed protein product [Pedinophyceae sp. YPF-701]|nr:unnamed protein product [Pedinophyceae sp. YPF-701]